MARFTSSTVNASQPWEQAVLDYLPRLQVWNQELTEGL
jgi:hypothetical protein